MNGKIERYLGAKVKDRGFRNFWGLESMDLVYKRLKGDSKLKGVVLAYRQAA